jgi:putative aldouronate transport system substrate-binding protein
MKKSAIKASGLMLAIIMVLASCAQGSSGTAASDGAATTDSGTTQQAAAPATNAAEADEGSIGNYTFSYWVGPAFGSLSRQRISGFQENLAFMERERITGVTIEWIHPPIGQEVESFSLMIAARDLPDMIQQANRYRGGIQVGINDGLFIRLNELIQEHAPEYWDLINFNDELRREIFTDDGYIQGFAMINSENYGDIWSPARENFWSGPFIRGDWLEELNLDVPETIDEWTTALRAIRDTFNPDIVMSIEQGGLAGDHGSFLSAWGIAPGWFQIDGSVYWGPARPEFRHYIELMRSWYEEGLIDPEFPTRAGDDVTAFAMRGELGARMHSGTAFPLQLEPENVLMVGAPYPRLTQSDPPLPWVVRNNYAPGEWTVITSSNQNPEAAVKWLNWAYTYEGSQIMNFGPRGVTFDEFNELGAPIYFEEWAPPNWDPNNDVFRLHNGPYLKSDLRANPRRTMEHLERFRRVWHEQESHSTRWLPPISLTADEGAEDASIMADAISFRDEMLVSFITGTIPLSDIDNYLATMESFNVRRSAEIREVALQRFLAR